jgi:hypothetical protein
MTASRLSKLQEKILQALTGFDPPWKLSGGAALAAAHTRHRETRDIDLFWENTHQLGRIPESIAQALRSAGLEVESVQKDPGFARFRVSSAGDVVIVDLIADPVSPVEPKTKVEIAGFEVTVDTPHEILVNKLCALLSRSELRDLEDVRVLLDTGGELSRALADAPRKDRGFSTLTLAWVLREMAIDQIAERDQWTPDETETLRRFRDELVDRLTRLVSSDE